MEETVPPSASTSNEVTHDEEQNLSTAAEISNAPNVDSVEVRPTRPSKPPQLIAEGKCTGAGTVRVIPNVIDAYRAIQRLFTDKRIPFHSYQLKEDKGFRVVIRGLHPSLQKEMSWPDLGTRCVVSKPSQVALLRRS
ncbi:GH23625 [Drosophila grimshawi]|uniref:GH23625 n=1 Tax=Drosophila grimshawi TaxID=7222 RepID=B4K2V2_DROGR|nr:GH23625 [Drosophila grimshawi]